MKDEVVMLKPMTEERNTEPKQKNVVEHNIIISFKFERLWIFYCHCEFLIA